MSNAEDIGFEICNMTYDRIWSNPWGQFYDSIMLEHGFMIHETGQKYVSAPVRDVILGMKNRLSDDIITHEYTK
jgi:hypothetical protein